MLKSVNFAIPIFSMMCLRIPTKIIRVVEQKMKKFFWNGSHDRDKIPFLSWDKIYKPKTSGGVAERG